MTWGIPHLGFVGLLYMFSHSQEMVYQLMHAKTIFCFTCIPAFMCCSGATWMRVSVWLALGVCVYAFYGRTHSSLQNAVYVPATHVDEIYQSSASLAY